MPLFTTTGLFSTPSSELYDLYGVAISAEQKVSRIIGGHNVKTGFRWVRQMGNRSNPQNPSIRYQSKADLLANRPNVVVPTFGAPPHESHLDEFGLFVQDDWRVNKRLVLNLGLRYDHLSGDVPAQHGSDRRARRERAPLARSRTAGKSARQRQNDHGAERAPHGADDTRDRGG